MKEELEELLKLSTRLQEITEKMIENYYHEITTCQYSGIVFNRKGEVADV